MSITVLPIQKVYKYNGISLPELPGYSDVEARDFYAHQYPELVNAEIVPSEPTANGKVEITFRRSVGTKGARDFSEFCHAVQLMAAGSGDPQIAAFDRAMRRKETRACADVLARFADNCAPTLQRRALEPLVAPPSETLPPVP